MGSLFKKKKSPPTNSPDTSRTIAKAYILEQVCAGRIEGWYNGLFSYYIDKTPYVTLDSQNNQIVNFSGVYAELKLGTSDQLPISNFGNESVTENQVGIELQYLIPITRSFKNPNVDFVYIRVSVLLYKQDSETGVLNPTTIKFNVSIKEGSIGDFVLRENVRIEGKFTKPNEFIYRYPVTNSNEIFVKLERTSDVDPNKTREVTWVATGQVISTPLYYKDIAYLGESFDAELFGGNIPERLLRIYALNSCVIPSNGAVNQFRGITYVGNWNGTFITPINANRDPAWLLFYLYTDYLNGLGKTYSVSDIDTNALYAISLHNNELVPDGLGGLEPRYLIDCVIREKDTKKYLDAVCSNMAVKRYEVGGKVTFIQERPINIVTQQFTNADVENGVFTYSESNLSDRPTVVKVAWQNPDNFGETEYEYVRVKQFNDESKYPYNLQELGAFGCYRKSQAIRLGRMEIVSAHTEPLTVAFTARSWAVDVQLGELIAVIDNDRLIGRYGGLVENVVSNQVITLDFPVSLAGGDTITVLLDGFLLETRNIINGAGVFQTITVDVPFSSTPQINTTWRIENALIQPLYYVIISKTLSSNNLDRVGIVAKQRNLNKWDIIDNDIFIELKPNLALPVPNSITISGLTLTYDTVNNLLNFDWNQPSNLLIKNYIVSFKEVEDVYGEGSVAFTNSFQWSITATSGQSYQARVLAVDSLNNQSDYYESNPLIIP